MCGRFALGRSPDDLRDYFSLFETPEVTARYNIAPSTPILAIRERDGRRRADPLLWGLIPHWAKERKTGYSTINARAETADTAPSYRAAFLKRRCLIPADGFYEWQAREGSKTKQPYFISRTDGAPLAMAGLWEQWRDPRGDAVIESCTILVTAANALVAPIHHRMPVLLDPEDFAAWLDPGNQDREALKGLLRSYPEDRLRAVPVSPRVGNPRNDDPTLVEPVGEGMAG
ncbi:SOS response-associated peptidase [Thiococcus pfennigii]|uniref:SOS response-associated peptidase n=1 Tax=Thiococcus pfennigii TaxID=1057 RepID=UPI00190776D9|nr:SOS response-associated peptidase [Thiococcus pfennigii]MBK1733526.1 hypothetical protein [Thiococcus pfennigii]